MDSAYTGLNYLSYWNEKTSFWIGNTLFFQMQYHSPSRQYSFIQTRFIGALRPLLARSGFLGKYVQGVGLMGWVNTRPLVCDTSYGMARPTPWT